MSKRDLSQHTPMVADYQDTTICRACGRAEAETSDGICRECMVWKKYFVLHPERQTSPPSFAEALRRVQEGGAQVW
jgi:hypothetical protein